MSFRKLGWLVGVALVTFGASISFGHDFGGTAGALLPTPPTPQEPCDSCPCSGPDGNGNGSAPPTSRSGSPISFFNGGESLVVTDLTVPGEFPIKLTRKYDSQSTFDSPLGAGWSFMLSRSLYEYTDGSIVVRHGCGSRDRYVIAGGAYVSPTGGMLGTLAAVSGGYELKYGNGVTDSFDNLGRLTAVRDARGNRQEYTYDSRGKLPLIGVAKASVDPTKPGTIAYVYRITRIEQRGLDGILTGRYLTFQYNETTGRLASATANDGRTVSYAQDVSGTLTKGNLVQVNMLDGQIATYGYSDPNDPHNLTSITEAAGRTPVVNVYDANDRVISQTEGTRRVDFNYQTPLVRTIVTKTIVDQNGLNPFTAATTYEFDASGRITKIISPLGHEKRYTYDASEFLIKMELWQKSGSTLSLQRTENFTYDTQGRRLSYAVTLDSGETITQSWTYDHEWIASEQFVSSAAPTKLFRSEFTFNYGADGRPINVQSVKRRKDDGSFQTTSYTYDTRNRLIAVTLPDGVRVVTEYTGDFVSRKYMEVAGSAVPQGDLHFDHDAMGRMTKGWDSRNNLTTLTYDNQGRITSQTNPLGEQNLWTYVDDRIVQTERGHTTADGEGQITKYLYDTRGRLIELQRKNDAGAFVTYMTMAFDSEGRQIKKTDATNRSRLFTYDVDGRLASTTDLGGKVTQFSYDAADNRTGVRDALGRDASFEYDDLNRLTAVVSKGVTPNPRTEYTYDAIGNMTSVRDAENRITTYAFDALSHNVSITQPLGQEIDFTFDSRDRVDNAITALGQKVDYDYEAWGPLQSEKQYVSVSSPTPARTIIYSRDADGHVISVSDSGISTGASISATYDVLGRLYDETMSYLPGGDRVLQHRYDRYGNESQMNVTGGGATSNSYTTDKLGRLTTAVLGSSSVSRTYYANDTVQSLALPGGVTRTNTYKTNGLIDTISISGSSGSIAQFSYAYDDVQNVDTMTDADGLHDYSYDGMNRLTQATHPASSGLPASENYSFTPAGDRKDPANLGAWTFDANHRVSASPGLTYTYDAAGNLQTRSDSATFTHDIHQRLTQLVKGGVTTTYLHDSYGRRIQKTSNGITTWYLWDGRRLIAEFNSAGVRTKRYAYLRGVVPLQVEDPNGTYTIHSDQAGEPRILTGSTGQVVWRARFESYGKAVLQEDADGNGTNVVYNFRLPGQYFDSESSTYYSMFRDYDPSLGRFQDADPIGLSGGINQYAYAESNPLTYVDPLGLAIYRGPGPPTYYSDIPPPEGCEVAIMSGDVAVGWKKCDWGCGKNPYGYGFGGALGSSDDGGAGTWTGGPGPGGSYPDAGREGREFGGGLSFTFSHTWRGPYGFYVNLGAGPGTEGFGLSGAFGWGTGKDKGFGLDVSGEASYGDTDGCAPDAYLHMPAFGHDVSFQTRTGHDGSSYEIGTDGNKYEHENPNIGAEIGCRITFH